jgi:hypothetical protein
MRLPARFSSGPGGRGCRRNLFAFSRTAPWLARAFAEELDEGNRRCIAVSLTDLDDARVATGSVFEALSEIREQLVNSRLVADEAQHLPAGVEIPALAERH